MNIVHAVFSLLLRLILLVAGIIFALSLVVAGTIATLAWLLRLFWHRATGRGARPVRARVRFGEAFERARAPGFSARFRRSGDVTDVEIR